MVEYELRNWEEGLYGLQRLACIISSFLIAINMFLYRTTTLIDLFAIYTIHGLSKSVSGIVFEVWFRWVLVIVYCSSNSFGSDSRVLSKLFLLSN